MSDHAPITGEMRKYVGIDRGVCYMDQESFDRLCDAIDAIHAQLEKENAALKAELDRVTGEQEEHAHTRGESITDELREYALGWDERNRVRRDLTAIADRIDAEHERQLEVLYRDMSDAEYVKLPKDADGVTIHAGDVLDGYGKTIEVVELRYGRSGWVLISRDDNAYADTYAFSHRQPDSWERIIEDALGSRWSAPNELSPDFTALVARCKKLAGDAE